MVVILTILGIISVIYGLYFGVTCFMGFFKKHVTVKKTTPVKRLAAVIAARNEENVITELAASLMNQNYPQELFDIYVIPNNCSDGTEAAARNAGCKIISCNGISIHSKGDALHHAFSLLLDQYDAYCIFDADNVVDANFFQTVNDYLCAGYDAGQGYRDSKNPYASWVSGSMSAFYWFMSRFYNESRMRLGMSAAFNGTGFMISNAVVKKIGWNTKTLTEDLEYSALCAMNGFKIAAMKDAKVYDEQPETFKSSVLQRRRWSAGSFQCTRYYAYELLKKKNINAIDMGLLFLGMPMNIVALLSFLCMTIMFFTESVSGRIIMISGAVTGSIFSILTMAAFAWLLFSREQKANRQSIPGIWGFPVIMMTWFPINVYSVFAPVPKWKAIKHNAKLHSSDN